jgi:phospholipase/lecithinase/hemolysin
LTIPKSSEHSSGFKEVQTACCGVKRFNGEGICDKNANLCLNRHEYLFWDLFHPTMTASKLAALTLYAGEPRFVSPINFKQLAEA